MFKTFPKFYKNLHSIFNIKIKDLNIDIAVNNLNSIDPFIVSLYIDGTFTLKIEPSVNKLVS